MGLLDAFKQYWQDASPGGVLNPEIPKDTPVLGLLADPMGSIRSTLNKANAQADAHLNKLAAASRETAKTGKWTGPSQQAYQGEIGNWMLNTFGPLQTVWHGSPHKFDKFDASKIGTGEGAQAYGHGLYLAENQGVAEGYKNGLSAPNQFLYRDLENVLPNELKGKASDWSDAILQGKGFDDLLAQVKLPYQKTLLRRAKPQVDELIKGQQSQGSLYKVDLPDDAIAKMLDWDKPLSQQHPDVQAALRFKPEPAPEFVATPTGSENPAWAYSASGFPAAPTPELAVKAAQDTWNAKQSVRGVNGSEAWNQLWRASDPKQAAEQLRNAGIPGIRYLDGGSRGTGAGTSNFVVFPGNEGLLTILERNGQKINDAPGLLNPAGY